MKLISQKQFKDVEEEQVTLQPDEPEDMVITTKVPRTTYMRIL